MEKLLEKRCSFPVEIMEKSFGICPGRNK